jgi:N-acyl-D-amino-acid deacylase
VPGRPRPPRQRRRAGAVAKADGVYTAHIRDEREGIIEALQEAFAVAKAREDSGPAALILSHHKCAGLSNWGRAVETLGLIDQTRQRQPVYLDCYPYTAGSTIIRPDLADGEVEILINWSEPHPEMGGRTLKSIAHDWGVSEPEAAERLQPGGASYFQMAERDMRATAAAGIAHVFVNGVLAWTEGGPTPERPGRFVRRGQA